MIMIIIDLSEVKLQTIAIAKKKQKNKECLKIKSNNEKKNAARKTKL